jgi:hypothetical protein
MYLAYNFLLKATRILQVDNYDDNDLEMIYNYVISIDYETLIDYNNNRTILIYDNDLEFYIEIIDVLTQALIDIEDYEKCQVLKYKKEECLTIMNKI